MLINITEKERDFLERICKILELFVYNELFQDSENRPIFEKDIECIKKFKMKLFKDMNDN